LQSQGSLAETSLKSLLEAAQGERSTGTLTIRNGSGKSASLYFLFGHLFHAICGTQTGEAAVRECLAWHDVSYAFDQKPPLPTDETIERPLDEILA